MSNITKDIDSKLSADEISEKLIGLNGEGYLAEFVNSVTDVLCIDTCCIYEIEKNGGHYHATPAFISSKLHRELINETMPGQNLIGSVIKNNHILEEGFISGLLKKDALLERHKVRMIAGFVLNDIENEPCGILLLMDLKAEALLSDIRLAVTPQLENIENQFERVTLHKKLNKSKSNLRYLVDTSRDLVWEINNDGVFTDVSRSAMRIYGYQDSELSGMHYSELMSREAAVEFKAYLDKSRQANGVYDIVAKHVNKNGKPIQIVYNAKPKYDHAGKCTGFTGVTTDITESVRAQIAIKNNSELFSAILSRLPVIFFCVDETGCLVDIRGKGLDRLGVGDMDWVGNPGYGLFVGMDEKINTALSGETVHFESGGILNGNPWCFYTSMFFDSWTGYGAVGFAVDITEQKKSEEKLVHLLKDNRKLAQRLVEVQEEERRNLARELHDELGQSLTAVKSLATAITARSGNKYSEVRSLGNSIIDLSGRLYEVVNRLMARLRPDILDSLGFEATINSCIYNSHLERMGVKVNLNVVGKIDDLDEVVQITVYRLIQECLTNISKYAMASNIDIFIERQSKEASASGLTAAYASEDGFAGKDCTLDLLVIEVNDDGIGMDIVDDTKSNETNQKLGLQGMKERVTALGGELIIESDKGEGVKVKAILDLNTGTKKKCKSYEIKTTDDASNLQMH